MRIEEQVVSLEMAKTLKKLGVKQESFARWEVYTEPRTGRTRKHVVFEGGHTFGDAYAAFSVAELGAMLPTDIVSGHTPQSLSKGDGFFECINFIEFAQAAYHKDDTLRKMPYFVRRKEADARAAMLVYLIENDVFAT